MSLGHAILTGAVETFIYSFILPYYKASIEERMYVMCVFIRQNYSMYFFSRSVFIRKGFPAKLFFGGWL